MALHIADRRLSGSAHRRNWFHFLISVFEVSADFW
jgi:hypothetical protein